MVTDLSAASTAWERGRFDARAGPSRLLFGRMHEDASIELAAFRPGGRIFCIASAGCTAMALCRRSEVVAVDLNPAQVHYARRRFAGQPSASGRAERLMGIGRALAPAAGWRRSRLRAFLDLEDPGEQVEIWRRHFDTRRFRLALDAALSRPALRLLYADAFLRGLPARFGRVMRARLERGIARHPNRKNPYLRALVSGEFEGAAAPPEAEAIRLVCADAATFLEREDPGRFDGFALSNILDGAGEAYRTRLLAAVERAAAPGAVAVLRSFGEPATAEAGARAAEDRSMLWGSVTVAPVERL